MTDTHNLERELERIGDQLKALEAISLMQIQQQKERGAISLQQLAKMDKLVQILARIAEKGLLVRKQE